MAIYIYIYLFIFLFIYLFVCLFILFLHLVMLCYFTYLSFLFIYLFICLLIYVMLFYRRGHPGSAVFHCILQPLTLHMCHGSLTALGFLQWLNKTKIKKKNKKKKTNKQKG